MLINLTNGGQYTSIMNIGNSGNIREHKPAAKQSPTQV